MIVRTMVLVTVLAILSACGQTGEWDEEVRLSSGEMLKVHRTQHWTTTQPAGEGKSYINKEGTLEIKSSKVGSPTVPWKGNYLFLMIVDIDPSSGEYFIVATPGACWRWDELGRPDPPYIEYRFRNKQWQRTEWSGIAIGRTPNLWEMPVPAGLKKVVREEDIAWQDRIPKPYKVVIDKGRKSGC